MARNIFVWYCMRICKFKFMFIYAMEHWFFDNNIILLKILIAYSTENLIFWYVITNYRIGKRSFSTFMYFKFKVGFQTMYLHFIMYTILRQIFICIIIIIDNNLHQILLIIFGISIHIFYVYRRNINARLQKQKTWK